MLNVIRYALMVVLAIGLIVFVGSLLVGILKFVLIAVVLAFAWKLIRSMIFPKNKAGGKSASKR